MAIVHQLPPAATCSGFGVCFRKFSASSTLVKPIMLQYRALQNFGGVGIRSSPFGSGDTHFKLYSLGSRDLRVSSSFTAGHTEIFLTSRSHTNGSLAAFFFKPQFRTGLLSHVISMNRVSNRSSDGSIRITARYFGAFGRRSFSQVPGASISRNDKLGGLDGRVDRNSLSLSVSKKDLEWNMSLSCRNNLEGGGIKASKSKIFAHKVVDSSPRHPVEGGKNEKLEKSSPPVASNNQVPKGKGKSTQQPRSKKGQEKSSATHASSDAAAPRRASKKVSTLKDPIPSKNGPSSLASKKVIDGDAKVADSSVLEQRQPRTRKTNCKGKSTKEASSQVKSDELLGVSTSSELPQKERRQLYPPTGKSVLIVESVSKAKVIQRYLGDMFEVLPSYGHVRDLVAKSGSVRPDDDFRMVWEVPSTAQTHLKSIKVALSGTENLILASDPDREGEAIAWHIVENLQEQNALHGDINVARVVFNEITESAIKNALLAPRDIDANLVNAYLARRALDYLIGFNISPLLWRKLPGCPSAGRVQSSALSLICDRETEIERFSRQEYWTIHAEFLKKEMLSEMNMLSCHLTHFDSKLLKQLSVTSLAEANKIEQMIKSSKFKVVDSSKNNNRRNPPAPYVTSTLQQDAANKLKFSTQHTMKVAQKLYEGVKLSDGKLEGLITYMRTDGLHVSSDAAKDIRAFVVERYGNTFAPKTERKFLKKVKNAQEAHEAIRPTDIRRLPSMLIKTLDADSLKLYTLIWSRTVACQMESGIVEQIQVDIGNEGRSILFRSTSSRVSFLGYKAVHEDKETATIRGDENQGNERDEVSHILTCLKPGDPVDLAKVELKQHHTQPPARYSEAALVKKMEELGIGRPSTYASTIKVLRDRNYVTTKSRVLYPEFRGRMLSAFLSHHFSEITEYSFTADMENELDNVSAGMTEWKGLLRDYWTRFRDYCARASTVHIHEVEKMLEKTFGHLLFASLPDKDRTCPSCKEGTLIFRVSRFGSGYFIGCDQHPKCKFISNTLYGGDEVEGAPVENRSIELPKVLGVKPGTDEKVILKKGPFGLYVQLGEDRKGYVPKRASLKLVKDVDTVTLEDALQLLTYPIELGNHPKDGQPVILRMTRYGLYVIHTNMRYPVPKDMKPSDINMEAAVQILLSKQAKQSRGTKISKKEAKKSGGPKSSKKEAKQSGGPKSSSKEAKQPEGPKSLKKEAKQSGEPKSLTKEAKQSGGPKSLTKEAKQSGEPKSSTKEAKQSGGPKSSTKEAKQSGRPKRSKKESKEDIKAI